MGSIDGTWTEANASDLLLSSTPADGLLTENVKPSAFCGDTIQPVADFGNSTDSGIQIHAKDSVCPHQVQWCSVEKSFR